MPNKRTVLSVKRWILVCPPSYFCDSPGVEKVNISMHGCNCRRSKTIAHIVSQMNVM